MTRPAAHRRRVAALALVCGLAAGATSAAAQRPAPTIAAQTPEIGRVDTHIEQSDEAIGVVSRLIRPQGAEADCEAVCFLPSSTRPLAWRCGPRQVCELHCAASPPVGACR